MNRRARLRKLTRASSKGLRAAEGKKKKEENERDRRDRYAGFARVAMQEKHDPITGA